MSQTGALHTKKLLHLHYLGRDINTRQQFKSVKALEISQQVKALGWHASCDLQPFWTQHVQMGSRNLCRQISRRKFQERHTEGSGWKLERVQMNKQTLNKIMWENMLDSENMLSIKNNILVKVTWSQ